MGFGCLHDDLGLADLAVLVLAGGREGLRSTIRGSTLPGGLPGHLEHRQGVGRDASRIADEVIADLTGLVRVKVIVTLEIEAEIPSGVSDHVVRTVTENSRTLNFTSQGFERE